MTVDTLLSLAQLVALVCVSALCVYLIVVLVKANDVLAILRKDLGDLSVRARPVLENLEVITHHLKSVSQKIDDQVEMVKGSLESVKQAAENIVAFEEKIQESLEEPILRIGSLISGLVNRIASFLGRSRGE